MYATAGSFDNKSNSASDNSTENPSNTVPNAKSNFSSAILYFDKIDVAFFLANAAFSSYEPLFLKLTLLEFKTTMYLPGMI